MNELFIPLKKKVITESDRMLASDYIDWYGAQPGEYKEYADSFVEDCYDFNEETGEHEEKTPDKLPFADVKHLDNGFVSYTYNDCTVTRLEK